MNQRLSLINYKKTIYKYLGITIIFIVLGAGVYFYNNLKKTSIIVTTKQNTKEEPKTTPEPIKEVVPVISNDWMIDIKGAVKNPGTYAVSDEMRIIDVIVLSGGLLNNADTSNLNLSKKVSDQMVIIVMTKEEINKAKEKNSSLINNDAIINDGETKLNEKISINKATKEELMTLTGVGEVKANDIIEYRLKNNGFKTIEELLNIKGIKESLLNDIKDKITL